DPSYPIAPGIHFDRLPEDWRCATYGVAKTFFQSKSVEIAGFAQDQQFGLGGNTLTGTQKAILIYGEGSIPKDVQDVNIESIEGQEQIGPTVAHRLKVALMGGYDKVRRTLDDYRKFKHAVNIFIRDRDSQMIVEKMNNRQHHVLEFSFEHHVFHDELVSVFWADETMKCNYVVFGDVVSFDDTFKTNKTLHKSSLDKKNALSVHLLERRHKYGPCIEETDRLAAEVHATIEDCVGLIRNNIDKLTQFFMKIKEMKKQLEDEMPQTNYDHNNEALYADLLGVTVPEQVVIKNPKKSSNKGSKRRKSATEEGKAKRKPRTTRKVPFKCRTCSKCGEKDDEDYKSDEVASDEDASDQDSSDEDASDEDESDKD
nr:FAR1 DNA binding domain-containing protein [Tanacetum cinerariifolium]